MSKTLIRYLGESSDSLFRLEQAVLFDHSLNHLWLFGEIKLKQRKKKDLTQADKTIAPNIMFPNISDI